MVAGESRSAIGGENHSPTFSLTWARSHRLRIRSIG
jgi:hypothetical protein